MSGVGRPAGGRVRRVEAAKEIDAGDGRAPDYSSAFAADVADADDQSAEQWARTILEGAPRYLRWFVVMGWKLVLRLRLAPRGTAGTIAGWTETSRTPTSITLEVKSSLVTARKVLQVDANRVTLATYVSYEGRPGHVVWASLAPVHHLIEPMLVSSAVTRHKR